MDIEVQNHNDHYLDLIQDDVRISYKGNSCQNFSRLVVEEKKNQGSENVQATSSQ